MALIQALSKVDKYGKIKLPNNIKEAANLKEFQLVELKIIGTDKKKFIIISAKDDIG